MSIHESIGSHIIISSNIEESYEKLKQELYPSRVVNHIQETDFKLEHAKAVISEAYISESQVKYIVLGAINFNIISQNSLLKILEEPPKNIVFIIISSSKSNLLPTIRSRLPIKKIEKSSHVELIKLDFLKLGYAEIFSFLKENSRVSKIDAKLLVQSLYHKAVVVDGILLSEKQLNNFDMAFRLLELNAKPQNIFSFLLMGFMGEK